MPSIRCTGHRSDLEYGLSASTVPLKFPLRNSVFAMLSASFTCASIGFRVRGSHACSSTHRRNASSSDPNATAATCCLHGLHATPTRIRSSLVRAPGSFGTATPTAVSRTLDDAIVVVVEGGSGAPASTSTVDATAGLPASTTGDSPLTTSSLGAAGTASARGSSSSRNSPKPAMTLTMPAPASTPARTLRLLTPNATDGGSASASADVARTRGGGSGGGFDG